MKKLLLGTLFSLSLFANDVNQRIVTLAPSINEIVYALGLGNNVVANTMHCDYPVQSQDVEKIGGYSSISLEKILKVNPSIVIGQNYDEKLYSNLRKLAINTRIYETSSMNDILRTIMDLGNIFNKEEISNKIIKDISNKLKSLNNIVQDKKILIVISPNKDLHRQIYVSGNHLYFEDIIKASGNTNAYFSTSSMQPALNIEKIIKMNPDIIVLLAPFFENKKEELEVVKNSWKELPINASKNDNIYAVNKQYAGIPSHRVAYFIEDFKKILEDVRNKQLQ